MDKKLLKIVYQEEGKRRNKIRKQKRLVKYISKIEYKNKPGCKICGEYPYCYCGSNTPGVIDY